NGKRLGLVARFALGDEQRKSSIAIDAAHPEGSSIPEFSTPQYMGAMLKNAKNVSVTVRRLDDMEFDHVDFIKLDCEGAELPALQGGEQTIMRDRPILYIENDKDWQSPDLLIWLHEHRYRIYEHQPRMFRPDNYAGYPINVFGNIISAMLLCVPQ